MMEGMGAASIGSLIGSHDLIAKPPTLWRIMRYSHEHTSTKFAAQAANRATVSAICTRSPEDLKVVLMTGKTSGDSTRGVSHDIFSPDSGLVYDSGTPRLKGRNGRISAGETLTGASTADAPPGCNRIRSAALGRLTGAIPMSYALFSNDAKLSKTYPTEADVWKHARKSGLVVDVTSEEEKAAPRPVLDNDCEIKPCRPHP
jgi:hypothetical protein